MAQTNGDFSNQYEAFLNNIKGTLIRKLNDITDQSATGPGQKLVDIVIGGLESPEGIQAVADAANKVDGVGKIIDGDAATHAMVTQLLALELQFYNSRHQAHQQDNAADYHALQDAVTIKESIHNLLSDYLPEWVSKLFDILNELLKLAQFPPELLSNLVYGLIVRRPVGVADGSLLSLRQ